MLSPHSPDSSQAVFVFFGKFLHFFFDKIFQKKPATNIYNIINGPMSPYLEENMTKYLKFTLQVPAEGQIKAGRLRSFSILQSDM